MTAKPDPAQQFIEQDGDVYLGACDFERRWQGGVQFDSLKSGLNIPMRVPRKLYEEALEADNPLTALEDLYKSVIRMHQKLVREEVNRASIPVLETMGRIAPNVTEMVGGLEAIDGSRGAVFNAGTVGISQMELARLQGDIQRAISAKGGATVERQQDQEDQAA